MNLRPALLGLVAFALLPVLRAAEPAPVDDGVRVAVIGYHDFSATEPETEMRISTAKFRRQLETIRQLGLNVISMPEFEKWKRGELTIPDKSVLITIDDGWKSVYDEAFPVLKEFGYPFTVFLYKNYVDGGGRALTSEMIREMQQHGATIGSHSVSHPYPATVKTKRKEGPDAYDKFLRVEMGESKRFLESRFGQRVTTYAYPGGFLTQEMFPLAEEFGYSHLFTVLPGKVRRKSENLSLPRYVVLATHAPSFERAVEFTDPSGLPGGDSPAVAAVVPTTPHPVIPEPGAVTDTRLPSILADLSAAGDVDPETLVMKVAGLGPVPASWDDASKTLSWTPNRRMRTARCRVEVNWKDRDGEPAETPLNWSFLIDTEAAYVPTALAD